MTIDNTTKQRILDAAYRLFQQKGYHAVGLNEIVQECNAPKGSLYYYFPGGKEELAAKAIERARKRIKNDIEVSMNYPGDAKAVFSHHISELSTRVGKEGAHFSITLLALETMHVSDELRKECCDFYSQIIDQYEKKLLSCGYEPKDAKELAITIQCIVDSAISLSLTFDDMTYMEAAANRIGALL